MLVIAYGYDITKITYDALEASDIGSYLKTGYDVSLKPNLVVPGPASNGAVTHPEVTAGIIRYLKDFGIAKIKIIESAWVGEKTSNAFKYCGYEELSKRYSVPLIDLKKDKCRMLSHSGLDMQICSEALETDFLINIPVLKAHCQTRMTCCLKNLKGCIPDSEKRRFHTLGIHKPVAVLNALVKTGYCIVDGICGDLTFEEGGNPVESNRVIAGRDPLMVDSYCAGLIGYHPDEIGYLSYAKKIGVGDYFTPDVQVIELGAQNKPQNVKSRDGSVRSMHIADRYRSLIDERDACSACYSSLIFALHKMGGTVPALKNKGGRICIGQGFAGKTGPGIGVGNCACGFEINIKGCPPAAAEITGKLR